MFKLSDYNADSVSLQPLPENWVDRITGWPLIIEGYDTWYVMVIQAFMLFFNQSTAAYIGSLAGIDGVFGRNTYNAVITFQRDVNLTMDGVVGADTWRAMARRMRVTNAQTAIAPISEKFKYMYAICGYGEDGVVMYAGSDNSDFYLPRDCFYAQDGNGYFLGPFD